MLRFCAITMEILNGQRAGNQSLYWTSRRRRYRKEWHTTFMHRHEPVVIDTDYT